MITEGSCCLRRCSLKDNSFIGLHWYEVKYERNCEFEYGYVRTKTLTR